MRDKNEAPPASEGASLPAGPWVLAAAVLGSSMVFVDGTVVNVALPRMQSSLHGTAADMQWVVEAYALMLAALILVGGSLGDHLGRRRIFLIGVALFAGASLCCGLAPTIDALVFARAVQGVGGALLTPGSLALISANFQGEARGRAIGSWSGWTTITSAFGPVLGGWLAQNFSWRWVFLINLPLAAAVLMVSLIHVPESSDKSEAGTPLDWTGSLFATIGLGGVVYGLIGLGSPGVGKAAAWIALAVGITALGLFLRAESVGRNPMMPLNLFRSRTFSGANLLTLFLYAALGGALYFLPFDLIQVHHFTATAAGAALLPFVALMFLLSRWAGSLVHRYGAKRPLILGPIIAGVGLALLAVPGTTGGYWAGFFPAVLTLGLGMTITVAPLTTVVMAAVSGDRPGLASGVNNAVSRVASLLAVAVFGVILSAVFGEQLDTHMSHNPPPAAVRKFMDSQKGQLAGLKIPPGTPGEDRLKADTADSFVAGFRAVMLVAALVALASAGAAAILIDDKAAGKAANDG